MFVKPDDRATELQLSFWKSEQWQDTRLWFQYRQLQPNIKILNQACAFCDTSMNGVCSRALVCPNRFAYTISLPRTIDRRTVQDSFDLVSVKNFGLKGQPVCRAEKYYSDRRELYCT